MTRSKRNASESIGNTRVKVNRKNVGITLLPNLIKQTRKNRLNISRVTEQTLNSILDYLDTQNQTESSKFLSRSSFLKESRSAPVAQWLEQQPCKL